MRFTRAGEFVFLWQWWLAGLLPLLLFVGRALFGAGLGWMTLLGVVFGPLLALLLVVPPLITLGDGEVRSRKSERLAFCIASAVVWLALVVVSLSIPDGSDATAPEPSAFIAWGLPVAVNTVVALGALAVSGVAWVAQLTTAIVLVVLAARRSRSADDPAPPATTVGP